MKTFRFQRYSEDTFGEYAQTDGDNDNCASGQPIQYELKTPNGIGLIVTGLYCNPINKGEGWMIGVNIIDENKSIHDWVLELHPNHEGYRNQLTVVAPDDAELRLLESHSIDIIGMLKTQKQRHNTPLGLINESTSRLFGNYHESHQS